MLNFSNPQVMGILNITPDSFSAVGRYLDPALAAEHALKMQKEGAAIIDIGAEATNPKTQLTLSTQEELDRLLPVLEILKNELTIPISVDTSNSEVMAEAVKHGAKIINDIRALQKPNALATVAQLKVPVCLMHMTQPTTNTQNLIVQEVKTFLQERVAACLNAGIANEAIILDPGFGAGHFGKNCQQNLQLLNNLNEITELGFPVLVGLSRKTFIGEILNLPPEERLNGSLAAAVIAVLRGACIIRSHDVRATVEAIKIAQVVMEEGERNG